MALRDTDYDVAVAAESAVAIEDWEGYWRHTDSASAHHVGGAHESALISFWNTIFTGHFAGRHQLRVLDVACGNGAVLGYLYALVDSLGSAAPQITAVGFDGSFSALNDLRRRVPRASVLTADVVRAPFASGSFDFVVSQFGVEYGGPPAVREAARLVAPGGTLAAIMHLRGGGIYRECATNLRAIEAMARMVPLARAALCAGIAYRHGESDKAEFRRADRLLAPAVANVEAILRESGKEVAAGMIFRQYADIGHIFKNMERYSAEEVAAWLNRMNGEVLEYRGRMKAMLDAALDPVQFQECRRCVEDCGLRTESSDQLKIGAAGAVAWILVAACAGE